MILTHQKFELGKKSIIEKIIIKPPFRFATYFQDEACFIHFLNGKTKINSPYEQKEVGPKDSVVLKCGSYFSDLLKFDKTNTYEILVFHLYPDLLRRLYRHEIPNFIKSPENKPFIRTIAPQDIITKFIESLYFYFDNPELVNDELLELKIKELVLLLIQTKNSDSVVSLFSDLFSVRDVNIKEVVNNHIFSGLSVDDLASLSNVSTSTFNRTFQGIFNDTPANYIKVKRLERAKELLAVSTLTVSEIAFQTCFNDVAHFSRSFKSVYHCSPTVYKSTIK